MQFQSLFQCYLTPSHGQVADGRLRKVQPLCQFNRCQAQLPGPPIAQNTSHFHSVFISARGKNIIELQIKGFCNLSDKPITIVLLCFYRIPRFSPALLNTFSTNLPSPRILSSPFIRNGCLRRVLTADHPPALRINPPLTTYVLRPLIHLRCLGSGLKMLGL